MNALPETLVQFAVSVGLALCIVLLVGVYVLFFPEKAEKVAGWCASLFAGVSRRATRAREKYRTEAAINEARLQLLSDGYEDLIDRPIKVRFASVDDAVAQLQDEEVLVTLGSAHRNENVASALMAYLPKALIPDARQYLNPTRMDAADIVVAKSMLGTAEGLQGARDTFIRKHLVASTKNNRPLRERVHENDDLDLQGWLSRILLAEYHELGEALYPAASQPAYVSETDEFASWIARLAAPKLSDGPRHLEFAGDYLRVAVIFVAIKARLAERGIRPYRTRAKKLLYIDRMNSVYLMARDENIHSVDAVVDALRSDALIDDIRRFEYGLRRDFEIRTGLNRSRAVLVRLRRRQAGEDPEFPEPIEDPGELPGFRFVPKGKRNAPKPRVTQRDRDADKIVTFN